jgi:hypothetical protein
VYGGLVSLKDRPDRGFRDAPEFQFTVQDGRPFQLQDCPRL